MHWSGRGAALSRIFPAWVDMFFIRCTEEKPYASSLALIAQNGLEVTNAAPTTYSLEYAASPRSFVSLYLCTNFKYS